MASSHFFIIVPSCPLHVLSVIHLVQYEETIYMTNKKKKMQPRLKVATVTNVTTTDEVT